MSSNKPNFFVIGAGRSGTTALYTYLRKHPEIFLPDVKELNHFCTDFKGNVPASWIETFRSRDVYLAQYAGAINYRCIGDISPTYLISREAAQNIYSFDPKAKIIAILRSPIEVAYSAYHKLLLSLNEDQPTFESALALEPYRKQGKKLPRHLVVMKEALFYRENVRFSVHLQRYLDIFPSENIHIVLYDDFKDSPEAVYKSILNFLNVSDEFKPNFEIINSTVVLRSIKLQSFLRYPPQWYLRLGKTKGFRRAHRFFHKVLVESNICKTAPPDMKAATRVALQKEFQEEIDLLGSLINRDLSAWYKS